MARLTVSPKGIVRIRNRLGQIKDNLRNMEDSFPRSEAIRYRDLLFDILKTNTYQGKSAHKYGPYRRANQSGWAESLLEKDAVVKTKKGGYSVGPPPGSGGNDPEDPSEYATYVEKGHNSSRNGPVEGRHYARRAFEIYREQAKHSSQRAAKQVVNK